jgi:hypothetical protein
MTIGVEKRRKRILVESNPCAEAPAAGRWSSLRARIVERWGPIAPHGIATVALYLVFVLLARLIFFGRVQPSTLLYLMLGLAALLFIGMIAALIGTLWRALRALNDRQIGDGWRPILLTTLGAGLALLTLPRLFSKDVLSYLVYGGRMGRTG